MLHEHRKGGHDRKIRSFSIYFSNRSAVNGAGLPRNFVEKMRTNRWRRNRQGLVAWLIDGKDVFFVRLIAMPIGTGNFRVAGYSHLKLNAS